MVNKQEITKYDILQDDAIEKIYATVSANPGIMATDVQWKIWKNSLRYTCDKLSLLVECNLLRAQTDANGKTIYFPNVGN